MPPEEKLAHFDRQAGAHEANQEVGAAWYILAITSILQMPVFCTGVWQGSIRYLSKSTNSTLWK